MSIHLSQKTFDRRLGSSVILPAGLCASSRQHHLSRSVLSSQHIHFTAMRLRSQTQHYQSPSTSLLDLVPELRIRILDLLFTQEQDTNSSSKGNGDSHSAYLQTFHFYVNRDRISKTPTARGYPSSKSCNVSSSSNESRGIFLVCKVLRNEALDIWFSRVHFLFEEFSRQSRWLRTQVIASPSQPLVSSTANGGGARTFGRADAIARLQQGGTGREGWLCRVRNCEVRFDIETEREMRAFPSKLGILMQNLDMERMRSFRVVVRFVKTWFYAQPFSWRRSKVLRSRVEGQRAIGEEAWRYVVKEVEALRLARFSRVEDETARHSVFVWRSWEIAEGGMEWFEALGKVMSAEVRRSQFE